jgi:glycine/D-amino acid oxidase-like deaminating enzyme
MSTTNHKPVNGTSHADPVVIVGGGIVGINIALALLRERRRVIVVDPGIAEQRCSFGNAGSLSPGSVAPLGMPGVVRQVPKWLTDSQAPLYVSNGYWLKVAPWLTKFVLASGKNKVERISHALKDLLGSSVTLYTELLRDLGAGDLISQRGQLQLYPSHAYREKDNAAWQLRRDRGVTVEYVERDDIAALEPSVGERYACGVFLPNEGLVVNPGRLVEVLTTSFAGLGGEVVAGKVHGFDMEGGTVRGVVTDAGIVKAGTVVLAAGAWSNELSRQLGDNLPLQTQRGYHVSFPNSHVQISRPVVAADRKYFVSPMEQGLRVAGTVEFDGLFEPPKYERARMLMRSVTELFPHIDTSSASMWMGHRPCFPDSLPVIDRARRYSNVLYAFGNGHLGLTAAPMMGSLIADLVIGREPQIDLRPFNTGRFL